MTIFLVFLQSVLNALGTVVTQKVLVKRAVGNDWQTFVTRITHFLTLSALLACSVFSVGFVPMEWGMTVTFLLFALSVAMIYSTYPLRRAAYMNEKISVLQPFVMARQAFAVVISFLLLSESVSTTTFVSALLAIAVVAFAWTGGLKIGFNRYCGMILWASVIQALQVLLVVRFIKLWGPVGFYYFESIAIVSLSFLFILVRGKFSEWKAMTGEYLRLQTSANCIALGATIITLFFYKNLGVVVTSLVSFLYLIFLYAITYAVFREIPKRNDVFATVGVLFFIAVWTYFG